ncbi:MAG: ATP-binding protein [Polyangiaceae bacterium]|nr:ATP-binding protein [Polyangiaceae bacterium]
MTMPGPDGISGIPAALTGDLAALMRTWPWHDTPLGPPEAWPEMLRSSLSICLGTRFPIAIYWGPSLALVYNDAWRPILGTKHPWGLGRGAREVWPEIWDAIGPLFAQVVSTGVGTYSQDQLLLMHRYGFTEECYFNFTFSPIYGGDGRVGGIFNAVIETTERVVGERRLSTLRALGEQATFGVKVADVCDHAAATFADNLADLPFALIYLVGDEGEPLRLAAASNVPAGAPFAPASVRATGTTGATGAPDAPDARGATNATDAANAMAALLEAAAAGEVVVVEAPPERFGALPGGAWPEAPREILVLPLARAGQARHHGFLVAGANPRRPLDEGYKGFLRLVAGQLASAIAGARAFEEERRRAEELAELDRAKTTFFGNVSHEFRTPLTLMLGPLDDLLQDGALARPAREQLELVQRNGLRLQKLVNSLLDFSRIEAGRVRAAFEPTELSAYTAELASTFRSAFERASLALVVDCPPLGEPVYVDRDMWEKIVLNLVSNAFKFTFEGEVAVSLRAEGGRAVLRVRDTGTGVPPDEVPHLFERFHRVTGAKSRSHEGTGIGLALVHELVRMHQGTIEVASELGAGTTFTVALPLGQEHLAAERVQAPRGVNQTSSGATAFAQEALRWLPHEGERLGAEHATLGSREASLPWPNWKGASPARILFADDNADMRDYVERLLRDHWRVEVVPDGAAALEAARRAPPDLVLSDVMMPRLDGFQLLQALRDDERTRTVPVVLLSARAGEEATIEGLGAGADDYLVKPFGARELIARVRATLTLSRLRAEAKEQAQATARFEREARAQAESLLRALERTNAELDQFAYVASHDLKAPLRGIANLSQWIEEDLGTALSGEVRENMALLRGRVQRLENLIDGILAYSRAGRVRAEGEPVDVGRLLAEAVELLAPPARVRVTIGAPMPMLETERVPFQQVFLNLIGNAIKYVQRPDAEVRVECREAEGGYHFTVADNGPGIAPEFHDRIWGIFQTLAARDDVEGTGIGLSVVKKIVETRGGRAWVESAEGRGATFHVFWPRQARAETRP